MGVVTTGYHVSAATAFGLVVAGLVILSIFVVLHNVSGRSTPQMGKQRSFGRWMATRRQLSLDNALVVTRRREMAKTRREKRCR